MLIKATEAQVREMAALAVAAAKPVGMGMLHYRPNQIFKAEDFKIHPEAGLSLDYVQGRMTKLRFAPSETSPGFWTSHDFPPRLDYQSWGEKYPGTSLIEAVGAEVIEQ